MRPRRAGNESFAGKHALITGGSGGIGRALAQRLLGAGCGVTLIARRPEPLAQAAAELADRRPSATIRTLSIDVADERRVAEGIPGELSEQPVDLLINCAGVANPVEFASADPADLRAHMDINYFGAVWMTRAVLPQFLERGAGHVVNMASTAALIGVYGYSGYSPSKFALYGFSEVLRAELAPRGIGVTVVLPGSTRTGMLDHELGSAPPQTKRIISSARVLEPDQVADATLRAIAARRFQTIPGLENRLSVAGYRLLPRLGRAFLDLEARRATPRR